MTNASRPETRDIRRSHSPAASHSARAELCCVLWLSANQTGAMQMPKTQSPASRSDLRVLGGGSSGGGGEVSASVSDEHLIMPEDVGSVERLLSGSPLSTICRLIGATTPPPHPPQTQSLVTPRILPQNKDPSAPRTSPPPPSHPSHRLACVLQPGFSPPPPPPPSSSVGGAGGGGGGGGGGDGGDG